MTQLTRVSRTGYYRQAVESFGAAAGRMTTHRCFADIAAGIPYNTTAPVVVGTASMRTLTGINGLAGASVEADTVDGILELMFNGFYPFSGGYYVMQMDMTGNAGLEAAALSDSLDYEGAARLLESTGAIKARMYFPFTAGGATSVISGRIYRHSSPSQYILNVGGGSSGLSAGSDTFFLPLDNDFAKTWAGFGVRDCDSTTLRGFTANKYSGATIACPGPFNCFTGNLAPLVSLNISGTTRALHLEGGTVQDNWPGDGYYFLWQVSHTRWKWIEPPGSNPFGGGPGGIDMIVAPNGGNWDVTIETGSGVARFKLTSTAGGKDGLGGSFSVTANAYQTATDGGGTCQVFTNI